MFIESGIERLIKSHMTPVKTQIAYAFAQSDLSRHLVLRKSIQELKLKAIL